MSTLTIEISPQLHHTAQQFLSSGWFQTLDELIAESLQRYLESHSLELMTQFLQEDIEWGLYGDD